MVIVDFPKRRAAEVNVYRAAERKCAELNALLEQLGSRDRVGVFVNGEASPLRVDALVVTNG